MKKINKSIQFPLFTGNRKCKDDLSFLGNDSIYTTSLSSVRGEKNCQKATLLYTQF